MLQHNEAKQHSQNYIEQVCEQVRWKKAHPIVQEELMAHIEDEIDSILEKSTENANFVGEKILRDSNKTAQVIQENANKALENSYTILKNELLRRASLASIEVAKNHIINELSWNQGLHDKLIDESIEALEGIDQ